LHVLKTDGTALLQTLLDARMICFPDDWKTTLAFITVVNVVFPSNPTDGTLFTMEDLLFVAHIVV
jgi:hypothetical protein